MQNIIKQKLIEFKGKTFSDNKSFMIELEKAFKSVVEQTIKGMLVEEKAERGVEAEIIYLKGFNQCCAMQKEKAKKLCKK